MHKSCYYVFPKKLSIIFITAMYAYVYIAPDIHNYVYPCICIHILLCESTDISVCVCVYTCVYACMHIFIISAALINVNHGILFHRSSHSNSSNISCIVI